MEFKFKGKQFCLKGIPPQKCKAVGEPSAKLMDGTTKLYLLQLVDSNVIQIDCMQSKTHESGQKQELKQLLHRFSGIFEEAQELPPSRGVFDHRISLESESKPVNIRPYRYPLKQRDIIEGLGHSKLLLQPLEK
ncbi:hypothetical protein RND81_09G102700 [Saponaria officinalis]|uniref:Uncharacterized protein n=1 Tax=Saponaria officinalis TaxID=3572 RepID=A0AAW1IIX6_SAPOF